MPITHDIEVGPYVNSAVVSLPSGSDGDTIYAVIYAASNPGFWSGWSLEETIVLTASARFRVYSHTRSGGETTATLPIVAASGGRTYVFLNVPSSILYDSSVGYYDGTASFSLADSFSREDPRFSLAVVVAGLSTPPSIGGDYTEDDYYDDAGNDRRSLTAIADLSGSGVIDFTAAGTWDASGRSAILVVFFSPEFTGSRWWLGVSGWR